MALLSAQIEQFRCIEHAELDLDSRTTLITGPNGSGKTTVLEALYVLGRGRSFRTARLDTAVRHGQKQARVVGALERAGRRLIVGVETGQGETIAHIGGAPADSLAELSTVLPVQAIDPGVHKLIEEGPFRRRRFLDWGVFHVEQGYLESWKRYRRLLSHRNAALKRASTDAELHPWSVALAEAGEAVDGSRKRYLDLLAPSVADFGQRLLARPLTLRYRRGWTDEEGLAATIAALRDRDRENGSTEAGPHRAELVLLIDERRVQDEASRGQQKLTAAAMVLAQVAVESALHPGRSVVVIDDPAAELDGRSLDRLLDAVDQLKAQLVLTALAPEQLRPARNYPVFHVEQGRVRTL